LARDEFLAERIDELTVLRDAVIEVRPRREPRHADVADDLALRHPHAGTDALAQAREVVVHRLVALTMFEGHGDAVAARPPCGPHTPVGHRTHRCARRRAVIDGEMRTHAAENRMGSRPGEARRDPGELERRLEEALA